MPILRKRKIEMLQQLSGEELKAFIEDLPAKKEEIEDLFDYLEMRLEEETCNHTLNFTMMFLLKRRLNFPKVSAFLQENAGYCDCKVLENIVSEWRKAFPN